jgi:formylglycine-generating enzyme required for sulfatase activity
VGIATLVLVTYQSGWFDASRRAAEINAKQTAEAHRRAEEEAQRKSEEEAKRKADEDAWRKAEEDRKSVEAEVRQDPALRVTPGSGQRFQDRLADGQACPTCPELVVVPAGSFTMGSPTSEAGHSDREGPQHTVKIAKSFAVGRFAVKFGEWDACVADGGCNNYRPDDEGPGRRGRLPTINVSWSDAKSYLEWMSRRTGKTYRLLSEAEREYVTRAGTRTPYWWGSSMSGSQANFQRDGKLEYQTVEVDAFAPNPWGFYQVHGNVWEWTEDRWNANYRGAPADGSAWTAGDCDSRVVRGGSFETGPREIRSATRAGPRHGPSYRSWLPSRAHACPLGRP